jgi:hypothetical protein
MQLAMVILLGAGIWVSVLLLAISLCKAAKAGDQALEAGYVTAEVAGWQEVEDPPVGHDGIMDAAIERDLRVHPRPTRAAFDRRTPPEHPAWPAAGDPDGAGSRHPSRPPRETDARTEPRWRLDCSPITTQTTPATVAGHVMARQLLILPDAAAALGVTPEVLLTWEARYGYPKAHHWSTTPGRAYSRADVLALAESLRNGLSIASAINAAQAATNRRSATAPSAGRMRQPPASAP